MFDFDKPVFVFGYGSLMFPEGMNGRNMDYVYGEADIVPAKLSSYSRGIYAAWDYDLFYGIIKDDSSYLNGTIAPVYTSHDFQSLNISEKVAPGGHDITPPGNYAVRDVSELVTLQDGTPFKEKYPDGVCYSYVILKRNLHAEKHGETGWYEPYVDEGIKYHGDEFVEEFLKTSTNKLATMAK